MMEKLQMQTENKVDKNIAALGKLFPNILTEVIKEYDAQDKPIIEQAIDFDLLKQELSNVVVEGYEERYLMNWPDKKKSILMANSPINKTLRPCKEESVDFDSTENLYIEGDNIDVLKLLQETYLNKVNMIYIDPPYNTGNDSFVYNDNFNMKSDDFSDVSGQYDEDGNMLFDVHKNNESNGRFHTDWLNMIYPRLKLAKDLLTENGVIFISIDDNEVDNLKKICNEIFGESNYMALLTRRCMHTVRNSSKDFNKNSDFILCYIKNKKLYEQDRSNFIRAKVDKSKNYKMNDNDGKGFYKLDPIYARNYAKPYRHVFSNGTEWEAPQGSYPRYSQKTLQYKEKHNELDFNGKEPRAKRYLNEVQVGQPPDTILKEIDVGFNSDGTKDLSKTLGNDKIFSQPKPIKLVHYLISLLPSSDGLILDFFSGSSTTAHAVMHLNAEDGGKRKFIMVQVPEETEEKSEAYKAGYKNICEIGKKRIFMAGKKIKEENTDKAENLDTGFRVLKLDSTNMKDVFYKPSEYIQTSLDGFAENIKTDRSAEDLLFQVMLELGELLSSDIKENTIAGKKVFNVGGGNIIACFDTKITNEVVTEIAKLKPFYAVFRDNSMDNDSVATNFEQIFETYSPATIRKVL
jgi:adenine-specific DNA-methyltransferase